MNRFLRTTSTRRLLATIAGVIAAVAAGTAIAVAASGSGPVPARTSLARAIHNELKAKSVAGITAQVTFTNHLIDASALQGRTDPLLSGAHGRLWIASNHQLRLELQSDSGDAQVVVSGNHFSVYDPTSKTLYRGSIPASVFKHQKRAAKHEALPSTGSIQRDLNQLARHLTLSGAIPGDVAGQPAYTVRVSPKHDGGSLLGAAAVAWDSVHGIPLRVGVYARGDSAPVLELKVTDISFGPVQNSVFQVPEAGAKVVQVATPSGHARHAAAAEARRKEKRHAQVAGVAAVARHLPFKLVAPAKLDGLRRRTVRLLDWGGKPAALVLYGQNLGGVAVIQQVADRAKSAARSGRSGGGDQSGLSLPTVSIKGATGQELDTALGTMIRFTRGGVAYTVVGSVPAAAAELAARAL